MAGRVWIGVGGVLGVAAVIGYFGILKQHVAPAPQTAAVETQAPGSDTPPAATTTAETAKTETAKTEPAPAASTAPAEPAPATATKTEPAQQPAPTTAATETAKSETATTEAAKTEQGKTEPGQTVVATAEPPKAEAPKSEAQPAAPAGNPIPPSFDIVRVEPTGDSVVAGRAEPGSMIELLRNGETFSKVTADGSGQWVMVPPPLPKGTSSLTLRATAPSGSTDVSQQAVTVALPEGGGAPMVVLAAPDAPSKVLSEPPPAAVAQKPAETAVAATAPATETQPAQQGATTAEGAPATPAVAPRENVLIKTVEVDEKGRFFVSGTAAPGAAIQIYLNDSPVASVTAAADGTFGLSIEKGVVPGNYLVRVDDVDTAGKVLTRAETPFVMEAAVAAATPAPAPAPEPPPPAPEPVATAPATTVAPVVPETSKADETPKPAETPKPETTVVATTEPTKPAAAEPALAATDDKSKAVIDALKTVTVVRGDSLWRISRTIYGRGIRYSTIYDANTDQIRNPNKIYPGQVFVVPQAPKP